MQVESKEKVDRNEGLAEVNTQTDVPNCEDVYGQVAEGCLKFYQGCYSCKLLSSFLLH